MNNIQAVIAPKLKKSKIPYDYIGQTVYVFHDKENGKVVLSFSPEWTDCFIGERDNIKLARKGGSSIICKPKALTASKKAFKAELNVFFASQALVFPELCENCGEPLNAISAWDRRCMTAHILEKNDNAFPEVACHPQNKLFLGTKCGCHSAYDGKGRAHRKGMNCYDLAIQRFLAFKNELSEPQLIKAAKYLAIDYRDYVHA